MGCSESKNAKEEETLLRFKNRMQLIKQAISSRNALFAALSAYAICLKNTGAAFTDGFHPQFSHHPSSVEILPLPLPQKLIPPPPPLPLEFPYSLTLPMSMPEIKRKPVTTIIEEESDFEAEEFTRISSRGRGSGSSSSSSSGDVRPSQQQLKEKKVIQGTSMHQGSAWDYFFPEEDTWEEQKQIVEKKKVEFTVPVRPVVNKHVIEIARRKQQPVSLMQIFGDLDNHFLKAFESTLEVSQMLDYHSHFADNQPNDYIEEIETLATVLNKLLAWEMKLYDEIKVGEAIKYDYQKKVSLLNEQKKQGSNPKSMEKLKASISHLHTRYIVGMQSAVSTAAKINSLRDEQLYPKLVQLVDGMAEMWKSMLLQHESQFKIVYPLKSLDNPQTLNDSNKYQYNCTIQLCGAVRGWHTQFCGLIEYQKDFIGALHWWLKLSLIPIETNLKEKVSSPLRVQNAPIHELVIAWRNDLDNLPDEAAKNAISNFATGIQTIVQVQQQDKDLKLRKTCQAISEERELAIISLKQRLEDNEEACQTICKEAEVKSLTSLKHSLPDFFRALSEIAQACSSMYRNLRSIAENQHKEGQGEKKAAVFAASGKKEDEKKAPAPAVGGEKKDEKRAAAPASGGEKKDEKKADAPAAGGEKKDEAKPVSFYKMNMHCEGCAKKIRRFLLHLEGVETVKTNLEGKKLTVTGNVDPAKVKARLEEKTKSKVDIVSLQMKKNNGGGDKEPEE